MFCFIGLLKGPYSHQYYLNKNNAFLDASDLEQIEKVLEDQAAVARQNEEFKKSVTSIGTASIKRHIFKAGKMKISGAQL